MKKITVTFWSTPEARVFLDGKQIKGPGELTPIVADVWEGKHTVRFKCLNDVDDTQQLSFKPVPARQKLSGCARPRQ